MHGVPGMGVKKGRKRRNSNKPSEPIVGFVGGLGAFEQPEYLRVFYKETGNMNIKTWIDKISVFLPFSHVD